MRFPEISVRCVSSSIPSRDELLAWVSQDIGVDDYRVPTDATDAESLILHAGRRCYSSFVPGFNPNVTKIREELASYFENLLASRHGSVLEHATYTFVFENVTRVFTAELNRHRAGVAVSEGSLRYIRYNDLPFWMPRSVRDSDDDTPEERDRKIRMRRIFERVLSFTEDAYKEAVALFGLDDPQANFTYKKEVTSMLRRMLPQGICTGGMWTFNIRALRHILEMRTSPHAEEEIAYVFGLVGKHMHEREPHLFGDFELVDGFWRPKYSKV